MTAAGACDSSVTTLLKLGRAKGFSTAAPTQTSWDAGAYLCCLRASGSLCAPGDVPSLTPELTQGPGEIVRAGCPLGRTVSGAEHTYFPVQYGISLRIVG